MKQENRLDNNFDQSSNDFYKKLIALGLPILIQNLIGSSLNFIDVFMVGQLGKIEIASVGIANQVYFIFIMIVFGISSGTTIFSAQYWGKKDIKSIKSVLGIGYLSCIFIVIVFFIGTFFFPRNIISIFTNDNDVIELGAKYLVIVGFSYPLTVITILLSGVLRSTEDVIIPLVSDSVGILLNTILNYMFIFGFLAIPAMGVVGAAWATVIARFTGATIILSIIYIKKKPAAIKLKELFSFNKDLFVDYWKKSLPVVIQNLSWVAGVSVYIAVYGRLGTDSIAAVNVVSSTEKVCLMFFSALGHASRTMIGNLLGQNRNKTAKEYAWQFLRLSLISSLVFILIIIVLRYKISSIYSLSGQSLYYCEMLFIVMAIGIFFKAGNISLMMGTLQSGGDTKFTMFLDTIGVWCIGVPIAFVTAYYFKLPIYIVSAFVLLEEASKMIAALLRLKSGKWINNLVH